jgi:hypothetical protein
VTIYGNHVCQNDAWKKNIARKFEIIDRIEIVCFAISAEGHRSTWRLKIVTSQEKKYTISERVSHWLGGTNPMLIPLHGSAKINVPWT